MKTDLSLVLSQLPSCCQFFGNHFPSIFLHVFAVKVLVIFVKDKWMFLNCGRKFLFVSCYFVFDLFLREAIEQNIQSNAVRT